MRFPEFKDEWKENTLNDIADFSKGQGISKDQRSEDGTPCILYGELYTTYSSEIIDKVFSKTDIDSKKLVKSKVNDIIIPASGETAIDIATARCVKNDNVLLGGDLNIIRMKDKKNLGDFFSYELNGIRRYDIAQIAQGVSVVHLHASDLKGLNVRVPSFQEQRRIAGFLSLLDKRIELQKSAIEKLKSLMAGIYNRLFCQCTGDKAFLSEICTIRKGQQINGELLSSSNEDGSLFYVMNGGTEPSGYYEGFNSETNTISISEGGNSCGYVQWNNGRFGAGGHCYTITNVQNNIKPLFLYHYLKYKEKAIMDMRVGSGLPNIQKKDLERFPIYIPDMVKQQHIVNVCESVKSKMYVAHQLLTKYSEQKQFLSSKMFI